jgi:hypothetical protein
MHDAAMTKLAADTFSGKLKLQSRYLQFLWSYASERSKVDLVRRKNAVDKAEAVDGDGEPAAEPSRCEGGGP